VTSHEDPRQRRELRLPEHKSAVARYLFALVATTVGLVVTLLIFEADASNEPVYAPVIGAVVLAALYGGLGPALLAIALGWAAALVLLVNGSLTGDSEDVTRWWINLAVAVLLAVFGALLRARTERTADVAVSARTAARDIESLHELSMALSGALSSSDVAEAVTGHAAEIVSAQAAVLGLVEGGDLVIVDPVSLAAHSRDTVDRLPLDRATLLTRAAREGSVALAMDRATIERTYPDSYLLLREDVRSALAVPLRAQGTGIGAVAFLFDRPGAVTDEIQALARIAADLVAQALDRARLYERELDSRRALDRILRVAPRFLADDPDDVLTAICREARMTFGADYGVLWRIGENRLDLLAIDPRPSDVSAATQLPLEDFPRLTEAIRGLETSFISDVLETTSGRGLEFVRTMGIRSSLRTPVVISGRSELVLAISWQMIVSAPDPATVAVVRRFADQAGLALEQLERRRAESEAALRADDTRRLQEVTAALSLAATPVEVSDTCLEHALSAIGAEAGFVVLRDPDDETVELVAYVGYDDDELEAWRAFGLHDEVPFALAMASGEPIWALSPDEMKAVSAFSEARSAGWITLPLVTRGGARGALHVSLREPRALSPAERDWLQAMVAQCGQALERSGIYADEQRARLRTERLQGMTALLSNALTTADVAKVVVDEVGEAVDATAVVLAGVTQGQLSDMLGASGDGDDPENGVSTLLNFESDGDTPAGRAIRARESIYLEREDGLAEERSPFREAMARSGHRSVLFVPLVAGRRTNGLLVVAWEQERRLTPDERMLVEALTGQAAQALDRASHFEFEQVIAETLQRSVLPVSLPSVRGVELAARYLPGSAQLDVGGDWFDALELPDDKLGLVVGDVVGKGVQAAASMAQLRNAIRAFSIEKLRPSSVLTRLNRLAESALDTSFATVGYIVLDPETGICRLSCAGHPPPVLAYPDGRVELLEGARGLPLGTGLDVKYRQETIELPVGSVLVLYTDGLVERRGRSIDEGLADLRAAIADGPTNPDLLLEHILERVVGAGERADDIALLAARLLPVAPNVLDLTVPSRVDSMDLVRDAMRVWLGGAPFQRGQTEDVVLATWEACANAIEHAADPTADHIRVHAELDDSVVRVVVEDSGRWVDRDPREDRGLGLRLIHALVSNVDISKGREGTRIAFEKGLDGAAPVRAATPTRE
jgi:serine phosphatase RsbU (regulator of sigma subunit)/anti-sigma regulatory factor (Ser/Thr protein kinase)